MEVLQCESLQLGYSQNHVVVTQHPPGSADRVFLDACRVSVTTVSKSTTILLPSKWK
jgi:hypothetical protein